MDFAKLKHPSWTGIVMPIGLAIGSTFTPGTVRGALLVAAVIAVAWTVHNTEFGGKRWKITSIILGVCAVLAVGVFFIGKVVDARASSRQMSVAAISPTTPRPILEETPPPGKKRESKLIQEIEPSLQRGRVPSPVQSHTHGPMPDAVGSAANSVPERSANTIVSPVVAGPCSVVQIGGAGNQAMGGNCAPSPLVLDVASVETDVYNTSSSFGEKPGFHKTEITIIPNQPVAGPFTIGLEFDNPISDIGHTVKNIGAFAGGGPFRVGMHARETVSMNIGPAHPLVVVVFSLLPVKLVAAPTIEH